MDTNAKVTVNVARWTTEEVNLIDLVMDRVVEIQRFNEDEIDIYKSVNARCCIRIGTLHGVSDKDVNLFKSDRKRFWEKHIDKLDSDIIREISSIRNPDWYI